MKIHIGNEIWNKAAAFYVRMSVFVLERNMKLEEEFDEQDRSSLVYVVIYENKQPVSTGRYELLDDATIRIERIATLKEYRGQNLGRTVIQTLEKIGLKKGCTQAVIHSEQSAASFYREIGYTTASEEFYENEVPCVLLKKDL